MDTQKYKVLTKCMTYNHAPYIVDAMNGFCMQETSFPVIYVIIDDASTDGEQDVIMQYLQVNFDLKDTAVVQQEENDEYHLIYAHHNTNNNCYFNVIFLKYNHHIIGKPKRPYYAVWEKSIKYLASCDGDDYWRDPLKLQKQVDFLESHSDYSMVHTAFEYTDKMGHIIPTPETPLYKNLKERIVDGYIWDYLLVHSSFILYSTIVCRAEVLAKEPIGIDHGVFLSCARQGKIHYLHDITTSYRILNNSYMRTNQTRITKSITNAIFRQVYYFCSLDYNTLPYYRYNLKTRVAVSEAILSTIIHFPDITSDKKVQKLLFVLFSAPLNIVLLPIALCKKIIRRIF